MKRLARFLGRVPDWRELTSFLPEELRGELFRRSALAATFAATLELARSGRIELRQDRAFGPIYLRSPRRGGIAESGRRMSERAQQLRLVEALLFAAAEPLDEERPGAPSRRLQQMFRGCCASWRSAMPGAASTSFGSPAAGCSAPRPIWPPKLRIERPVARKLSRAAVETLAVIAYHQPVTRVEIEADPRRRARQGNDRHSDGSGLGAAQRPARQPRPAALLGNDPGLSRAFRPRQPERVARPR